VTQALHRVVPLRGTTLLADWLAAFTGLVVSQGLGAIVLIVVARHVTPVEFSRYLSCYTLTGLLCIFPNYGLETWLLAQGVTTRSELVSLWYGAVRLRLRLLMLWCAGMIALSAFLPSDTFPLSILLPTVFGVGCDSLILISYSALRSVGWHRYVTVLQSLVVLGLLGVSLVLPFDPDYIVKFSIGRTLVSMSAAVLVTILTRAWLGHSSVIPVANLLRTARAFFLSDLAVTVYLKADLAIVSLALGSSGVAIYGPALHLVNLSFLVPNALYLVVMPAQTRVYTETGTFGWIGYIQIVLQAIVGVILSGALYWLGQPIVQSVFGSAYETVVLVLGWLFPIPFLKSLNFGLALLLTTGQFQWWRATVQTICAIFNVVANLIVVIPLGVTGVSVVYVLSEVVLLVGYTLGVWQWWLKKSSHIGR
jgi:O-antigen/teichoic acid export membrane protein